jgi:hypothetical protein
MQMAKMESKCSRPSAVRVGAYGLYLPDLQDAADLLVEAPAEWMQWRIAQLRGCGTPEEFVSDRQARLQSATGGWVDIDRDARRSILHLPDTPPPGAIVHPYLATTAITAAHWRGFNSFHAGAFLLDGRAWGILGARGTGKSTLLAALHMKGIPILTDDLLIIGKQMTAFAGPRCIDLRRETAEALDAGEYIGVVGTRERWRLPVGSVGAEAQFGGWIWPAWDEYGLQIMSAEHRLHILFNNLALRVEQRNSSAISRMMDLFALPMIRYSRSRDIQTLVDDTQRVLDGLKAATA